jgi:hypothetical protein
VAAASARDDRAAGSGREEDPVTGLARRIGGRGVAALMADGARADLVINGGFETGNFTR